MSFTNHSHLNKYNEFYTVKLSLFISTENKYSKFFLVFESIGLIVNTKCLTIAH